MSLIIDRFEGDFAVCENDERKMVNVPRARLPEGAKEGDVLVLAGDQLVVDPVLTDNRRKLMNNFVKTLWK